MCRSAVPLDSYFQGCSANVWHLFKLTRFRRTRNKNQTGHQPPRGEMKVISIQGTSQTTEIARTQRWRAIVYRRLTHVASFRPRSCGVGVSTALVQSTLRASSFKIVELVDLLPEWRRLVAGAKKNRSRFNLCHHVGNCTSVNLLTDEASGDDRPVV